MRCSFSLDPTCALVLLVTRLALAQEWTEYRRVQDGFEALFPGQPRVTETTWKRLLPKGAPEPLLFVTSLGWLDKDGKDLRYRTLYSHEIHGLREAPLPARQP